MNILGINYFFHDTSACLMQDGVMTVAIEEERLSRDKHTWCFPSAAIMRCLEVAGLAPQDVDQIALAIQPTLHWQPKLGYALRHVHRPRALARFVNHEWGRSFFRQRDLKRALHTIWGASPPPLHYVEHHLSHGAGAYLLSPFENAAIMSLDGAGEWACGWLGQGQDGRCSAVHTQFYPHSLGAMYETVTQFCGFRPNYDEGKTMGLAPYGDAQRFWPQVQQWVQWDGRYQMRIHHEGFRFALWDTQRFGPEFEKEFGPARREGEALADHHRDLAAAAQRLLETAALRMARALREDTQQRHLVLAGGVALNSVMNGVLREQAGFDEIYVPPAAGDNGTALGAAAWVHQQCTDSRPQPHLQAALGTHYSDEEIEALLIACKLPFQRVEDIAAVVAERLHQGQIVGWFQGRMELGARALGHRSILADPSHRDMKIRINKEVKHRESWRPFAPAVPLEQVSDYFETDGSVAFMSRVARVREPYRQALEPICHVDDTARLQTVDAQINPLFHDLITKLSHHSQYAVILNTSFNVMGEPVVEHPRDALRCFFSTGLDALAMGPYLIDKLH